MYPQNPENKKRMDFAHYPTKSTRYKNPENGLLRPDPIKKKFFNPIADTQ